MAIILIVGGVIDIFNLNYVLIVIINVFVFGYGLTNGPVSNNYQKKNISLFIKNIIILAWLILPEIIPAKGVG